ncbi:hypothetical protein INR49_016189 [Caranx melampygus]|nr:hypothetical protein INR49_016189 [Caranx melampygus]
MAQRRAALLERQQKRTEEMKRRRQWHDQERENRLSTSDKRAASPSNTPPVGTTSPSPTPPATPARRGDFTRGEYARRQQLRIMEDLDKALRQKASSQGRSSAKKTRSRPRSMTREETQLSLSPAKGTIASKLTKVYSHSSLNLAATDESGNRGGDSTKKPHSSRPDSPSGCATPSRLANLNGDKDWESGSNGTSPAPEYTGTVRQHYSKPQEMEKSPANHFLILFRDSSCQFRGVYTMNPDSQELIRLAGVGPRTISSTQVESIYKYSSDRKQFSAIPSKTMGMSVDAFTIPGHLWQGGGGAGGGGSRRASITKKAVISKAVGCAVPGDDVRLGLQRRAHRDGIGGVVVRSSRIWAEVGGWLTVASEGTWDEGLGGASDVGRAGVSDGGISEEEEEEELDVVFKDKLAGVSEGESDSVCGRGSDGESVGEAVRVGLGVCAGVGSRGSVGVKPGGH